MLSNRKLSLAASLLVLATLLLTAPLAIGQTWTATTSGNWSTASNWNSGAGPAPTSSSSTDLTFNASGTTSYIATNNISNPFIFNQIILNSSSSATNTISGSQLQPAGSGLIQQNGSGAFVISNPIAGTSITFSGSGLGAVTLSGVISGNISVLNKSTGGVVIISNASNSYQGAFVIFPGATTSVSADGNFGAVPGSGSNSIVLINGTLNASASFTLNSNRGMSVGNSSGGGFGTIDVSPGQTLTYNGFIANVVSNANLIKTDSGTLVLGGTNTYSGGTTINGGTLSISADNNLGTAPGSATPGSLVINGGTLNASSSFTLNSNRGIALGPTTGSGSGTIDVSSGQTLTYNGITANNGGTGSLIKTDAGTLVLGGSNSYTGGATTINGGTLQLGASNSLPETTNVTLANIAGATLDLHGFTQNIGSLSGGGTIGGNVTLGGGNLGIGLGPNTMSTTFSGIISGAGTVGYAGGGTLTLAGNNTYTGSTSISGSNGGSLSISSDSNLGTAPSTATANSLIFSQSGELQVTSSFTLNSNRGITLQIKNDNDRIRVSSGQNLSYGGTIAGPGNLLLEGSGTVLLSGNNTYTGTTTISGGNLFVNNATGSGTSTGAVFVTGGSLGGSGSIAGPVTIQPGGTIMAGPNASSIGTLALGTSLTFQPQSGSSGAMSWKLGSLNDSSSMPTGAGNAWDQIKLNAAGSNLSIDSTALFVINFVGEASAPGPGEDPFWQSSHIWQDVILTTSTPTGNGAFTIDNSAWAAFGTFSTAVDSDPGIDLIWTPNPAEVPEPGSLFLLGATVAGAAGYAWRKRRKDQLTSAA